MHGTVARLGDPSGSVIHGGWSIPDPRVYTRGYSWYAPPGLRIANYPA